MVADIYLSKAHCLKQNQTMPNGYVHLVSSPIKKSNLVLFRGYLSHSGLE